MSVSKCLLKKQRGKDRAAFILCFWPSKINSKRVSDFTSTWCGTEPSVLQKSPPTHGWNANWCSPPLTSSELKPHASKEEKVLPDKCLLCFIARLRNKLALHRSLQRPYSMGEEAGGKFTLVYIPKTGEKVLGALPGYTEVLTSGACWSFSARESGRSDIYTHPG